MKIAFLTIDNREHFHDYKNETPWFGTAPEALLQGFAKLPSVEVHVVSCTQIPMKSPAKLAENIFFHSLRVPWIGWLKTGYIGCILAVRRKLREIGPDIVHGQGTERDSAISAVFSGYPNVLTIHGNMAELAGSLNAPIGSYLWCAGLLENFTLPKTGGVLCNSAFTESLVRPRAKRTWRVPNALRTAFFDTVAQPRVGTVPRLINVGNIISYKRQVELLSLFERLHDQGLACQIEFVGRVNEKDVYGQKFLEGIRRAAGKGYAVYSGMLSAESLLAAFDQADGCIHFSTQEAFGLVVAEALARNLKFIGSRTGGIIDIATDVEGTELIGADDWSGLEQALRRWLEQGCPHPKSAAQTMAKRYHPVVIAERHVEIYREVMESPR